MSAVRDVLFSAADLHDPSQHFNTPLSPKPSQHFNTPLSLLNYEDAFCDIFKRITMYCNCHAVTLQ